MTSTAELQRFAELQEIALNAARTGDLDMLMPMLNAGLFVDLQDEKGNSLLMLASYHGHPEMVAHLLERGAYPDLRNDRFQTALGGVAFKGHLDIARMLLDAGADPAADQGGGKTPAMFAAMFGHREILSLLERPTANEKPQTLMWLRLGNVARFTSAIRKGLGGWQKLRGA